MVSKKKRKVDWILSKKRFFEQILISVASFFTLLFFKRKENAIQDFFYKNYNVKKDEFIWDGTSLNYYNQITNCTELTVFKNSNIFDIGCGTGSFYYWLKKNNIDVKTYTGVDFAVNDKNISINSRIINENVNDCNLINYNVFVAINCFCYLSNNEISNILSKIPDNSNIIIIEPHPNIFWDKHFNNIKPHYRNLKKIIKLFEENSFVLQSVGVDYFYKINKLYFSAASYCMHFKKTK